jgi:hypothetical protein
MIKTSASAAIAAMLFLGCSHGITKKEPETLISSEVATKSPEEVAYEEAFVAANSIGANHALLKSLVGEWNADIKLWKDPTIPPQVFSGNEAVTSVFEERFIKVDFSTVINGKSFGSLSFIGFDNFREAFTSFALELGSTQMINSRGTLDKNGKVITFSAVTREPVSRMQYKIKSIMTLLNKNQRKLEVFETLPDGQVLKTMEINYNRIS